MPTPSSRSLSVPYPSRTHFVREGWVTPMLALVLLTLLSACGGGGGGVTINPQSPPSIGVLTITTTAIPDGITGSDYSFQFAATGGSGGYFWLVQGQTFGLTFTT